MASSFDLSGRTALVTGSTRGIGAGIAAGLARAGATVVLHGRNPARLRGAQQKLRDMLRDEGCEASVSGVSFDVTDYDAMHAALGQVEQDVGAIDVLVNNAGIQLRAPLVELSLSGWTQVLETNLTASFVLAQRVAHGMLERRAGKIINLCSVQTRLVRATTAPYAAAKAGLASLTRTMCAEWARAGIQVNAIAPGYIDTDLNAALVGDAAFSAWVVERTPARRWGQPSDLAGPAVFLASSASDFVNGQVIYLDGGMTAVI